MKLRLLSLFAACVSLLQVGCSSNPSTSAGRNDLETEAHAALDHLYQTTPGAAVLAQHASGILVFPNILEGGFIFGASYGNGVLYQGGAVTGYYNSTAASFGLQAGVDKVGYAMFFMSPKDMTYLHKSEGWELGVGPNVTLVDEGVAASFSSSTARTGIYAFFFQQRGLLAGITLKGTKITRVQG